jgi:hypothetical protein
VGELLDEALAMVTLAEALSALPTDEPRARVMAAASAMRGHYDAARDFAAAAKRHVEHATTCTAAEATTREGSDG